MADLLMGVDGGGSKTRVLLADRAGTILGSGSSGTSNYQSVGFDAATQALSSAIAAAKRAAGLEPDAPVAGACFGLAGVGRPADQARFEAWIVDRHLARCYAIVNDAELVLAGGTPRGWGVALICGTGSICYGRAPDGTTARAGGWGYLLGDEGGGYDIAREALRLATQTADGRAEAHGILRAVLHHWHLDEPTELIGCVYRPGMTRAEIAALAPAIVELAEAGDADAAAIVDRAAYQLRRLVVAVVSRLGLRRPPVACGGGLLGTSSCLRVRVYDHTEVPLGPMTYVDDPARGALIIAGKLLVDHAASARAD